MPRIVPAALLPFVMVAFAPAALAHNHPVQPRAERSPGSTMAPGLATPKMDAARGRHLFAGKGCVVCHSINGVGGTHARRLDANTMKLPMNPFEFAARMWRGAEAMIALQRQELGRQIELTGQDLADLIAFVHDADEQKKFSEKDIPHKVRDVMIRAHPHEGGKMHMHKDDKHKD